MISPDTVSATKKVHFSNLTGLRFFAALSVLIYHFYGIEVLNGHYGVILFFVLSGFLITYLLLEEHDTYGTIFLKQFYIRRILRIWPLYYLAILLTFIFLFTPAGAAMNNGNVFKSLPYYLFFIPNVAFVLGMGIGPISILWSVGAEEQFYLLWALLLKFFKHRFLVVMGFIFIFFIAVPNLLDFITYHFVFRGSTKLRLASSIIYYLSFNSMATGAILAYVLKYHPRYLHFIFLKPVQLITYALVILCWVINFSPPYATDQMYATLFGLIIVNLAANPGTIISLENKFLNYLGKISYGLYVYQYFTFTMASFIVLCIFPSTGEKSFTLFVISLAITVAIASISYQFFEKPFLNWKARKFSMVKSG